MQLSHQRTTLKTNRLPYGNKQTMTEQKEEWFSVGRPLTKGGPIPVATAKDRLTV